ncbi:hypothetical protein D3C76_1371400 [compost metagenome]
MGLAGKTVDLPDIQQHLLVRVIVFDLDQWPRRSDDDAQLFMKLPRQGPLDRFAVFNLAARELPQAALMLAVGTAGNQDAPVGTADDRNGYMHTFHPSRSARPAFCQAWKAGHW